MKTYLYYPRGYMCITFPLSCVPDFSLDAHVRLLVPLFPSGYPNEKIFAASITPRRKYSFKFTFKVILQFSTFSICL